MELIVGLMTILIFFFWYYFKNVYSYWSCRGVVGPKPWPIFGNYGPSIWGNLQEQELIFKIYHDYPNEKCVGIFKGMTPVLLMRDPLLIKYTFEKNVETFFRRTEAFEGLGDQHVGGKDYDQWKINRRNISTLFSNSNLENIMPLLKKYIDKHQADIENTVEKQNEIDIKAKYFNFYAESIYVMCLGVSFNDFPEGSEIKNISRILISPVVSISKLSSLLKIFPLLVWPVNQLLKFYLKKFTGIVKKVLTETKILQQNTDTFTGRLIYLKDKIISAVPSEEVVKNIDDNFIAQNFLSMLFTMDTSVNNFTDALLELAYDQDAQEKAHQEIVSVLKDNDGKLSAKAIMDMTYLLQIQEETTRVNSKLATSYRRCNTEFEFQEFNFSINRKAEICAPFSAILTDPQHFPEPQTFNPNRYSAEHFRKLHKNGLDINFGSGPRMCIARRFAKLMVLLGLISFLQKYRVEPSPLTKHRLELDEKDYQEPKELKVMKYALKECWVKIQRRKA